MNVDQPTQAASPLVQPRCNSHETAVALYHESARNLRRAHHVAQELLHFVAVGEIAVCDWDPTELPPWAVSPAPVDRYVPSDFARHVAADPYTHAAAMSPGMRRELLTSEDEAESPFAGMFIPDDAGRFPRELKKRSNFTTGGEMVWLNELGRRVADVLRREAGNV